MEGACGRSPASIVTMLSVQCKKKRRPSTMTSLLHETAIRLESPIQLGANHMQMVEIILEGKLTAVVGIERQ